MLQFSELDCVQIVKKVIKSDKNVRIESFKSEQFGDFLGYSGEYYRFEIAAKIENERKSFKFFVKSLPIVDTQNRRESMIATGFFLKEVKIYEKIFTEFKKINDELWCPNAYLLRDDLIVLDNLSLMNYEMFDKDLIWLDQKYIEAVLRTLANFHACSLIYERNEKIKIGEKFNEILFETSIKDHPWFHSGLETIRQVALKNEFIQASEAEIFYENLFSTIKIMESSPFGVPNVLCHRDIWKNNLMFSKDLHCVLIDFQIARYMPLSVDLAMIIYCSTSRDHYEKMGKHYVNFYYENLSQKFELSSILSKENLLKSCEFHKHFALIFGAILTMYTKTPKDFFANFSKEEFLEFTEKNRHQFILKAMVNDSDFDKIISESVKGIVDIYRENIMNEVSEI